MTCPRKCTSFCKKLHLDGFNLSPASCSRWNTCSRCSRHWLMLSPATIMSSIYTRHSSHWRPRSTVSMRRSNVAGALTSPNGMTLNSYRPILVEKAVFSWSLGCIFICQNPDIRSIVQKYLPPFSASRNHLCEEEGRRLSLMHSSGLGSPHKNGLFRLSLWQGLLVLPKD